MFTLAAFAFTCIVLAGSLSFKGRPPSAVILHVAAVIVSVTGFALLLRPAALPAEWYEPHGIRVTWSTLFIGSLLALWSCVRDRAAARRNIIPFSPRRIRRPIPTQHLRDLQQRAERKRS